MNIECMHCESEIFHMTKEDGWVCTKCGAPTRTGFYVQTDDGQIAHVQGDPDMDAETLSALTALIKAAYKAVEGGEL